MHAHAPCMRTHTLSMRVLTCVCVRMLRVFCAHYFLPSHPSSQSFIKLGPKSTLDLRVMSSLENGGLGRKGYRIRCLQQVVLVPNLTPPIYRALMNPDTSLDTFRSIEVCRF